MNLKSHSQRVAYLLDGMDGGFAFGKESRLAFCWQADNGFSRTCEPCFCLQRKQKVVRTLRSGQIKRPTLLVGLFIWLGWMGSNHRNARVKVWCLTAWLHPNIALVLYHILFYLSSTLLKNLKIMLLFHFLRFFYFFSFILELFFLVCYHIIYIIAKIAYKILKNGGVL